MALRSTYTYAILEVSKSTFDEIAGLLKIADYSHAFHDNDEHGTIIDMHGIALAAADPRDQRSVMRSREAMLDPAIREFLNTPRMTTISPASSTVGQAVSAYLAGALTLEKMQIELIMALAKQADSYFEELGRVLMVQPILFAAEK